MERSPRNERTDSESELDAELELELELALNAVAEEASFQKRESFVSHLQTHTLEKYEWCE